MARDPQTALVALHRFGLGARGGASGDFSNAIADPRGFVKSELSRPNGVLLEMPSLQSTPQLALAVFAFQDEQKKEREAISRIGKVHPDADVDHRDAQKDHQTDAEADHLP